MGRLVRPLAAAAAAVLLLAVARPAAADQVASEFSETQATFSSPETGEQVWCWVNG
jgi:hypothetical protein